MFPAPVPPDELRMMWTFTPEADQGWALTADSFTALLESREQDPFTRLDPGYGTMPVPLLHFGITLDDEPVSGIAGGNPGGAAIEEATAGQAAEFITWLRTTALPADAVIRVNTDIGTELALPDTPVASLAPPVLLDVLLQHARQCG